MSNISKLVKENNQLIKKIFHQRQELNKIKKFRLENDKLVQEIRYELRVGNPSLSGNKLEMKINQEINKIIKNDERKAKEIAKRKRNEEIVRLQDVEQEKKRLKRGIFNDCNNRCN